MAHRILIIDDEEDIPAALEMSLTTSGRLEDIFLRKLLILHQWLEEIRPRLTWHVGPYGWSIAEGAIFFDGQRIGTLVANGMLEVHLHSRKRYRYTASMWKVNLADVAEAVALLALDLADLRNADYSPRYSNNSAFQKCVTELAKSLRKDSLVVSPGPIKSNIVPA